MSGQVRGIMEVLGKSGDPPEIGVLQDNVRSGRPCVGDEFVGEAERLTERSEVRTTKTENIKIGNMS